MSFSSQSRIDSSRCKILESRNQYRACHVRVPDAEGRLAAIVLGDRYYSYFRLVKEPQKTLQLAVKLIQRGDEVAITRTTKGDVIWIYESDAKEDRAESFKASSAVIPNSTLWKLLNSERDYQSCQIRVPDVAKPMKAIYRDRQYYSLFRTVREQTQAIDFAERLASKGQAVCVTGGNQAWSIWVLEPEASLYA